MVRYRKFPVINGKKQCVGCKEFLPIEYFYKTGKGYRFSECKHCCKNRKTQYKNSLTPEQKLRYNRAPFLKKLYGITLKEYDEILKAQDYVCGICKNPPTGIDKRSGLPRSLCVDHCHETGKIRALLCGTCNNGLGCFKDDVDLMREAILYLEKHKNEK